MHSSDEQRFHVRRALARVHARVRSLHHMVHQMADELTRLQGELDDLNTAVDTYEAGVKAATDALTATITDLQAQLAAGPPGLTSAQGDALAASIAAIKAKLVTVATTVAEA